MNVMQILACVFLAIGLICKSLAFGMQWKYERAKKRGFKI